MNFRYTLGPLGIVTSVDSPVSDKDCRTHEELYEIVQRTDFVPPDLMGVQPRYHFFGRLTNIRPEFSWECSCRDGRRLGVWRN